MLSPIMQTALNEINKQLNRPSYLELEEIGAIQALATVAVAEAINNLVEELRKQRASIQW